MMVTAVTLTEALLVRLLQRVEVATGIGSHPDNHTLMLRIEAERTIEREAMKIAREAKMRIQGKKK